MTKQLWIGRLISFVALVATIPAGAIRAETITYVGEAVDKTDYSSTGLNIGTAGYWFAQFAASSPVTGAAVNNNDRNAAPAWTQFDFTTGSPTLTFSATGPVTSAGGNSNWNTLTLPSGETGLSGSIVDANTAGNSNNTVSEILLQGSVPASFLLGIVVDNTNHEHDPINRIRARGQTAGNANIEANTFPQPGSGGFDGIADVYTFRYDGFVAGDFIKIQLNGAASPSTGAGFAGLTFDVVPEPTSAMLLALGLIGVGLTAAKKASERKMGPIEVS
jgi:PEP-CTERM motif